MWHKCLRLSLAENLHKFSQSCRDKSSFICRHHLYRCAGSISKRSFSIRDTYGVVWRNILEPGFQMVRLDRTKPHCSVLPWCPGAPVALIRGSHVDAHLPQPPPLPPARTSSAWGVSHWPLVMPSMVAPSSHIRSPTLRMIAQMTFSLTSR